jgi:hypothetical protein
MALTFEDLDNEESLPRSKKAFWELTFRDPNEVEEKNLLNWLRGELDSIQDEQDLRMREIKRNHGLYRGIQYSTQEDRKDIRDRSIDKSRNFQKITVNHLFDLVENRVSALVKFKPGIAVLPTNDELGDKAAAEISKLLLEHIWYKESFESTQTRMAAKLASVSGEAYLWIDWDPAKGDVHPNFEGAKKESEDDEITVLGEDGNPLKNDSGEVIKITKPVRVGDVAYNLVSTFDVFLQKQRKIMDVEYCFKREIMHVNKARTLWPDKANKIKENEQIDFWNFETLENEPPGGRVEVWEFYHKRTDMVDDGRRIYFTRDTILSNTKAPYNHRELPFERLTDIEFPEELHGRSFFDVVKQLTGSYNNLTNMILRNQIMVSHPKWMVPAQSVKLDQLGNDITIVQYKGPQAPVLAQANPTGKETFEFRKEIKEEFQQIAGVFGVSRGEPPAGIKAGVALQFLNEQENERRNDQVIKYNEWIRRVAIKTLAVAADYYKKDDKRTIRVLGRENEWLTEFFDASNLSKTFDIRVQNASALPQTKSARTQTLLDLHERFPNEVPPKQVLDMLDLAQSDKFLDVATAAVRMAEAENEMMFRGKDMPEPKDYEDLIEHWKVHARDIQTFRYIQSVPEEGKQQMEDHIRATEMMMVEKALRNEFFQKKLAVLDLFPIFFEPPPLPLATEGLSQSDLGVLGVPGGQEEANSRQPGANSQQVQQPAAPQVPSVTSQTPPPPVPDEKPVQPTRAI